MGDMFVKPVLISKTGSLTTTGNDYVVVPDDHDSSAYFYLKGYHNKLIELKCETKDLFYCIDSALVVGDWHPLEVDILISAGSLGYELFSELWNYMRI